MKNEIPVWFDLNWDEFLKVELKHESVIRPEVGGKCQLCQKEFSKDEMLEIFKIDLPEHIMETIGIGRYGESFCERCYRILDCFILLSDTSD